MHGKILIAKKFYLISYKVNDLWKDLEYGGSMQCGNFWELAIGAEKQ